MASESRLYRRCPGCGVTYLVFGNVRCPCCSKPPRKSTHKNISVWVNREWQINRKLNASWGDPLEVYNPWPGVMESAPASKDYAPGFMVDLMVKDLGLAMEMAGQAGVDNRMGQLARQLYEAHQQQGNGRRDFSSIQEMLSA